MSDLGKSLRAWRERVQPGDVGLPAGGRRRAVGLRREELAHLAGVSADYLVRLEQGRSTRPSAEVIGALARALRLGTAEHDHLLRVAGHGPSGQGRMRRHVTPGLQRVLERLDDLPVVVIDAAWTVVTGNALGTALLGDWSGHPDRERNVAWRHFTGLETRAVRPPGGDEAFAREVVADLHEATGRHPDDPDIASLVADLRATSPQFASLWDGRPAGATAAARKAFEHPAVGRVEVDCDVLRVDGTDLRLVVYSAAPRSRDAEALRLLSVVGLQDLDARVAP